MLLRLHIQNYALIDQLTVDFNEGFSTLTGETGAGKSILLGALALAVGNRADTSAIGDAEKKCVVEATFNVKPYRLESVFADLDLDYQDETIVRRELLPNGKSRAFVNDTPVNVNNLKTLGQYLIDIHSQHENLELNNNQFQLRVVDAAAKNADLLNDYAETYRNYRKQQTELETLRDEARRLSADYDYNQFQYNQLAEFAPEKINQQEMEDEFQTLSNVVEIQQNLNAAVYLLQDGEQNLLSQLSQLRQTVQQVKRYFPKAADYLQRLESVIIEMKDFAQEIEHDAQQLENQPERLEFLRSKLDQLYGLLQKHQVADVEGLVRIKNELEGKLGKSGNYELRIEQAEKLLAETTERLKGLASQLTERRTKMLEPLSREICSHLTGLGMPNAQLRIDISESSQFTPTGCDCINFMFTANRNRELQNISKIASGGEISRLMLSIKAILSASVALPTIIFDEIDTGVSGDIAHKMAELMSQMAEHMQVITITHLPQIAAKGDVQYRVVKRDVNGTTQTFVEQLSDSERVDEVARMLSGKDITNEARENAKSLLNG
ncbi:MAG: DNA repair protein RecN [Salinivirgaceae bacterium]|nr:DNA repair protein RecN [Salinivirgaceae bacterium]